MDSPLFGVLKTFSNFLGKNKKQVLTNDAEIALALNKNKGMLVHSEMLH